MYALQSQPHHRRDPIWRPPNQFAGHRLGRDVRRWLLDTGSLTAHLRRLSDGHFHVQVLDQRWGLPSLSERQLLGMADRDWAVIRQVLLCCHGEPVVYARSLLPARSLVGNLRRLRHLDNRPLGHLLFTEPNMRRIPYQVCQLAAADLPLDGLEAEAGELWGRRSCFIFGQRPIMVSEIFLPAFTPW